jgi:hypothetical protein
VPNATATCTARRCGFACNPGRGNCDGDASNGCEIDIAEDRFNCGMCGRVCMFCGGSVCIP